jgi:hypothetical protein
MPNTQSFLVQITGDKVEVHRAKKTSKNRWDAFAPCSLEEVGIPALQLGLNVLSEVPDGWEMVTNPAYSGTGASSKTLGSISMTLHPIKPPNPTGLEYLLELPSYTIFAYGSDEPFVVMRDGIHWPGEIWRWDGSSSANLGNEWHSLSWVKDASAETIKPWSPNES